LGSSSFFVVYLLANRIESNETRGEGDAVQSLAYCCAGLAQISLHLSTSPKF
jgi:hypothetical protein